MYFFSQLAYISLHIFASVQTRYTPYSSNNFEAKWTIPICDLRWTITFSLFLFSFRPRDWLIVLISLHGTGFVLLWGFVVDWLFARYVWHIVFWIGSDVFLYIWQCRSRESAIMYNSYAPQCSYTFAFVTERLLSIHAVISFMVG